MKKFLIIYFFFVSLSISLFGSHVDFTPEEKAYIKNSEKIKIGSIDTYIPFSFIKNGEKIGFTQDLIDIISKKSGLHFEKIGGTWPQVYGMFQDNQIDMITEFSYRKERLPFTLYSKPYYEIPIGVFTRNDFGNYTGLESLKNKKIGVVKNSYIVDVLLKENMNIVEFDSADERFFALNEKKVDVVLANAMTIYKLENLLLSNIKVAGRFIHNDAKNEDLRFGIRIEKPILASIINKTLDSIPFSTLSALKQDWILNLKKSNISLTAEEKNWIDNNEINVGIEQAKPYIFFDEQKNINTGLYYEILRTVIEKTGLKVNAIHSDWSTLLADFKDKKIDLLPATFYSKERENFGLFSDEYYKVREYIYVSEQNSAVSSFLDLKGKKVAITKGYATIEKIQKKFPNITIIETTGLNESVSKVLNGEVDALVDYHLVVENYIRDNSIVGLKDIAQYDLDAISVHFLSNIDKPLLHSVLQKGLKDISREEMNTILKKWVRRPFKDQEKEELLTENEQNFIKKHPKIKFGVIGNRPPFELEKDGKPVGIAVDYIKKSAQNMGLEVEFIIDKMSMKDAYKVLESKNSRFDTMLMSVRSEERAKRFSYGSAYLSYPMMIIKHKNASYVGSMKDLNGKTIVLEENYLTNKWIKKDYPNIKIINVKNTEEALTYVNDEKADAYVGNLAVANYLSIFGGLDNIKIAAPSGYGDIQYSFIAPKKWPELTSILSKGFHKISAIDHSAIQQKWFSLQTVDKIDYSLMWKIIAVAIVIIVWILWWNRKIMVEKNRTKDALKQLQQVQYNLEQKNLEVQDANNFLESVLDESPDLIIIKNCEGKFLLVNRAVANLYNTTVCDMIGKYDRDFVYVKDIAAFFNKNLEEIIEKGKTEVVYENLKGLNTNEVQHYITTKKPFTNEKNEQLILIIAHNITTIKKLEEEQLKQQQMFLNQSKIAAMGEMLGNISHQWRQPLSVITTQASAIQFLLDFNREVTEEQLRECSTNVMKQANYLSKTIDDFRNFFMSDSTTKQVYNLKEIFFKQEDLIKIPFENNFIKTINQIDDNIEVELNENILIQAFINIFNNAKDAFLENNIHSDDRYFFVTVKKEDNQAIITFKDTAGGIKKESIDKIFEPYFTTKHQSVGTGIGLYMTNQIITKHLKGDISAINETFEYNGNTYTGAKFIINLPLS